MIKSVMVDGAEAMKLMADGKVAWERSGLPAGYQRCAYLESSGTQIIDTLYHPIPQNTRIEFEFTESSDSLSTIRALMGTRIASDYSDKGSFNIFQRVPSIGNGFRIDICYGTFWLPPFLEKVKFVIDVCNNIMSYNDVNINHGSFNLNNGMPTKGTFKLFNFDTNGNFSFEGAVIRIHSFVIYDNDIPVIDFVPCIDADGVPCMYDTVSKHPFYNRGTGEFLYELA